MKPDQSITLYIIGFLMVLAGAVLPFLIVLRILPSTFFLNFFAWGVSVAGLFLGVIATAYYVRDHRKKR